MAGTFRGNSKSDFRPAFRKTRECDLDLTRRERHFISGRLRIMDRLYRLHLAAAARSHIEGFNLCVRQSGRRGVFGMAGSARAHRPLHCDGQRRDHCVGGAGDERKGVDAERGCGSPSERDWRLGRSGLLFRFLRIVHYVDYTASNRED